MPDYAFPEIPVLPADVQPYASMDAFVVPSVYLYQLARYFAQIKYLQKEYEYDRELYRAASTVEQEKDRKP